MRLNYPVLSILYSQTVKGSDGIFWLSHARLIVDVHSFNEF